MRNQILEIQVKYVAEAKACFEAICRKNNLAASWPAVARDVVIDDKSYSVDAGLFTAEKVSQQLGVAYEIFLNSPQGKAEQQALLKHIRQHLSMQRNLLLQKGSKNYDEIQSKIEQLSESQRNELQLVFAQFQPEQKQLSNTTPLLPQKSASAPRALPLPSIVGDDREYKSLSATKSRSNRGSYSTFSSDYYIDDNIFLLWALSSNNSGNNLAGIDLQSFEAFSAVPKVVAEASHLVSAGLFSSCGDLSHCAVKACDLVGECAAGVCGLLVSMLG